jgi:hypothetical protein
MYQVAKSQNEQKKKELVGAYEIRDQTPHPTREKSIAQKERRLHH